MPARRGGVPAVLTLFHESRFGLTRAAVFHKGRPHLYAEGYDNDASLALQGVRSVARLKSRNGNVAFLTLADGSDAVLDAPQEIMHRLTEGAAVGVEIVAEARREKIARARYIATAEGAPRRLSPQMSLKDRLLNQALTWLGDQDVVNGDPDDVSDALNDAEEGALEPSGPLTGGGYLSIERTRALIACDVDTAGGDDGMVHTARDFARGCNERAVTELARRLRLSGFGGLIVIDLVGVRHDAERLRQLLLAAFAAEASGIVLGQFGKFGTFDFARPWGGCPLIDADPDLRSAHRLLRQAAERAENERGRVVTLRAPVSTLDRIRPLLSGSLDPLAPMLRLEAAAKPEVVIL